MDIEELTAVLGDPRHAPEPDVVMAAFARKRRRRARRRWSMAGGCLAAGAAAAAAVVIVPRPARSPSPAAAFAGPSVAVPVTPARGAGNGAGAVHHIAAGTAEAPADACTPVSLSQRVADAVRAGGSVIIADASGSGAAANGREPVVLRDVRTLRGPRIASAITGYAVADFTHGGLRGQVFAIVLPPAASGSGTVTGGTVTGGTAASGPAADQVMAVPVSGGTVRFAGTGCWRTPDMPLTAVERIVTGK